MSLDPRYVALRAGLDQLTTDQLQAVLDTPDDLMLFDGGNYDPATGRYCPLAIGLGVPTWINKLRWKPIDPIVSAMIGNLGLKQCGVDFVYNQLKDTPGQFYRDNRAEDFRGVVRDIIDGRNDK